jgi:hypothetical protein
VLTLWFSDFSISVAFEVATEEANMDMMWLDVLFLFVAWFIGAAIFLAVIGIIAWVLRKALRFDIKFKGEVFLLALLAIIEPFVWHTGIDRTFAWDWQHVFGNTLPSIIVALLLLWWINKGKE